MKKLIKIGALSLALIASVFLLNTNTQAATSQGDVQLEIQAGTSYCIFGKSVDLGVTGFSYAQQYMSTGFLNQSGAAARFCEDLEGDHDRKLQIEMLTNVVNMDNPTYFIPEANVDITNPQATASNGTCTPDTPIVNTNTSIDNATELFGKTSDLGEVCTITTASVGIRVDVPAAQNVGAYSGTIQVSYDATLGDGLMTP